MAFMILLFVVGAAICFENLTEVFNTGTCKAYMAYASGIWMAAAFLFLLEGRYAMAIVFIMPTLGIIAAKLIRRFEHGKRVQP